MKYVLAAVLTLFLVNCSHFAGKSPDREPSVIPEYSEIKASEKLTFQKLKNLVLTQKYKTIEETMPILASKYGEFLKFRTMMYRSLSLHGSSFAEPRVIAYGPNANFVLTFNGNPNQLDGTSFETMEYSGSEHKFLFREIIFKSQGYDPTTLLLEPNEIEYQDNAVVISNSNPGKCLQCHGQNASPIWATYFLWSGAYGSNDDQLEMSFDKSSWYPNNQTFMENNPLPQSQGRKIVLKRGVPDAEVEGLIAFVRGKDKHSRYKYLPPTLSERGMAAYAAGKGVPDYSGKALLAGFGEIPQATYKTTSRPNLYFQMSLMRLNQDRLIAALERADLKNAFKSDNWETISLAEQDKFPPGEGGFVRGAGLIHQIFQKLPFKKIPPTSEMILEKLKTNLKDELNMQIDKVTRHQEIFGKESLIYFKAPDTAADARRREPIADANRSRTGSSWIKNSVTYLSHMMNIKQVTEVEKIAINLEGDNVLLNTALQFLLLDNDIDLHDYNMNMYQQSLSFFADGLGSVYDYLGIQKKEDY